MVGPVGFTFVTSSNSPDMPTVPLYILKGLLQSGLKREYVNDLTVAVESCWKPLIWRKRKGKRGGWKLTLV